MERKPSGIFSNFLSATAAIKKESGPPKPREGRLNSSMRKEPKLVPTISKLLFFARNASRSHSLETLDLSDYLSIPHKKVIPQWVSWFLLQMSGRILRPYTTKYISKLPEYAQSKCAALAAFAERLISHITCLLFRKH